MNAAWHRKVMIERDYCRTYSVRFPPPFTKFDEWFTPGCIVINQKINQKESFHGPMIETHMKT